MERCADSVGLRHGRDGQLGNAQVMLLWVVEAETLEEVDHVDEMEDESEDVGEEVRDLCLQPASR
jgi:hypothetical protein